MTSLFCCRNTEPYKPRILSHEPKFSSFLEYATFPRESSIQHEKKPADLDYPFVIQLVQQVNHGPLESKRYFMADRNNQVFPNFFVEITEADLVEANYMKLNAYKNYKCTHHNKFFEVNIYQKDPVNTHHWRSDIARPGTEIDL
ncbi:hypothetical protein FKW77_005327 [Venturia effusa]|uniref:Uncharacterized protein n=1 Tax=Venturia effusa TaxID=50376 RepID=A0A517L3B2_9PEZI|nr:hypothetical protein FKW77_005327 [Venturia effusa]